MQNPGAIYASHSARPTSTRYTGIAFAALVNGVAIWAILNGLTFHPGPPPPPPTTIQFLQPEAPPTPPMKQPPVTLVKPTMPATPVVPQPVIPIQQSTEQNPITVTTQPQPANPPIADSGPSGLMDTHSTPPYPADARNLSQQGTVTLALSIDATGAVTNAQVKVSSGYPELDQTAVSWVMAHWRYKPAIQNGAAVASATLAAVRFDLKNAG
jgi:protein TonB